MAGRGFGKTRCGAEWVRAEVIFDSFLEKLRTQTEALKLGDPLDEATDIGSIIPRQTTGLQPQCRPRRPGAENLARFSGGNPNSNLEFSGVAA